MAFSDLTCSTNTMPILQLGMEPIALDCELDALNVSSRIFKNCIEKHDIKILLAYLMK